MTAPFTQIEPLREDHECDGFESGEPQLDDWLLHRAWRNQVAGFSRTYVTTDGKRVVGYMALSACTIMRADATGRARRQGPSQLPAVLLGRLAIDRGVQGHGLGAALLRQAMDLTVAASETVGVRLLLVNALDPRAAAFYHHFGLSPSPTNPLDLMITVADIQASR